MQSPLKVEPKLDESTKARMRACTDAEFPLCLENALLEILGGDGMARLESILRANGFERTSVYSPSDVWLIYENYIAASGKKLGADAAQVIEFHTTRHIESMQCTKCPLYEAELVRLMAAAPDLPSPRV